MGLATSIISHSPADFKGFEHEFAERLPLHLSINLVGLIGVYTFQSVAELTEPQILNLVLGSQAAIILSAFILVVCVIALLRTDFRGSPQAFPDDFPWGGGS